MSLVIKGLAMHKGFKGAKRHEEQLYIGDLVYLKLQPYRERSLWKEALWETCDGTFLVVVKWLMSLLFLTILLGNHLVSKTLNSRVVLTLIC